jgi:hypothetical protein
LAGFIVGFDSEKTEVGDTIAHFIELSAIPVAMVGLLYALRRRLSRPLLRCQTSIGEMWIGAKQAVNTCDKTAQMRAFNRGFIHAPGMRICGSSVDDMCAQLYESNQPSNRYNKIL